MWTQLRRFLLLEQLVFLSVVLSGMFLLGSATFFRLESIWNENKRRFIITKDKIVLNVWNSRNAADFLHYLKFEFVQFTFHGSLLIVSILVRPEINRLTSNPYDLGRSKNFGYINIHFGVAALLDCLLLRLLLSKGMRWFGNKLIVFGLFLAMVVLRIWASVELILAREQLGLFEKRIGKSLLVLWMEVCLVATPCLILYWMMTLALLRLNIADMNAQF